MGGSGSMNALELIDQVRACGAEVVLDGDQLKIRGRGSRLPEELRQKLKEHKPELMAALGAPTDRTVQSILSEIRPHLSPALQTLSDEKLLALVNLQMMHAWNEAVRKVIR